MHRWAGIGPYYAMFPTDFAFEVVRSYTEPGQAVLDPFAGRASSIYAAAALGRSGLGVEINPVGWLYGRVKLAPAAKDKVLARARELGTSADLPQQETADALPEFFRVCYAPRVLQYLLKARSHLRWKDDTVDATLMAVILVYLHGKEGGALSNQMRQGKSMAPDYSIRWWRERAKLPPDIDPVSFLESRLAWRYAKGIPALENSTVLSGDSTTALKAVAGEVRAGRRPRFDLLFTSPPYCRVTNYHYDQWLRLWMLGGPQHPTQEGRGPWERRFDSEVAYKQLLDTVFTACAEVMSEHAVVYVRTDARPLTHDATLVLLCYKSVDDGGRRSS
ncbi:MAG: site-specific DNA-methyltransferase [Gemmatimonadota bacterium]|nr:site-specific DNA-methyltransferase [Gemmatimonadota bacterium]